MLDAHVKSPVTRRRLRSGLAADHIDAFAAWLHRRGYRPKTIVQKLCSLASWTDWMRVAGFSAPDLLQGFTACQVQLEKRPRVRYRHGVNHESLTAATVFIERLQPSRLWTLPSPHGTSYVLRFPC